MLPFPFNPYPFLLNFRNITACDNNFRKIKGCRG